MVDRYVYSNLFFNLIDKKIELEDEKIKFIIESMFNCINGW